MDDAIEFEMMLQDVSSGGGNPKLDCRSAESLSKDSCPQSQDQVLIKSEPVCNSPSAESAEEDLQPVNFSLSASSLQHSEAAASVNGPQSSAASVNKISQSSSAAHSGDSESSRLQKELGDMVAANLALQEELSARDFHLAQLAEDFFSLHEQFRQLARHFQAVLRDIQQPVDPSGVNRTVNNHVS